MSDLREAARALVEAFYGGSTPRERDRLVHDLRSALAAEEGFANFSHRVKS